MRRATLPFPASFGEISMPNVGPFPRVRPRPPGTALMPAQSPSRSATPRRSQVHPQLDWRGIVYHALVSRALDEVEETTNRNRATVPKDQLVLYHFSHPGPHLAQPILPSFIPH